MLITLTFKKKLQPVSYQRLDKYNEQSYLVICMGFIIKHHYNKILFFVGTKIKAHSDANYIDQVFNTFAN